MKLIFLVFGKSLLNATGIFFLVYFIFSVVFVSNLGPIAAFIVAADSFVLSIVVLLLVVSLRELKLRRMVHAAPLTRSEHELLKSTRIDLRAAVLDPKSSSAFTQGLIRDLQAICVSSS